MSSMEDLPVENTVVPQASSPVMKDPTVVSPDVENHSMVPPRMDDQKVDVMPEHVLGKGIGCCVFAARTSDGKFVACKDIPNGFRREAKLMRLALHPNVMPVLGTKGSCILMPLMVCLNQLLGTASHMSLTVRLTVLLDVAKDVQQCHSRGIVHRDIAARNVMVNVKYGVGGILKAVLSDFGMSRLIDESPLLPPSLSRGFTNTRNVPKIAPPGILSGNSVVYDFPLDVFMFVFLTMEVFGVKDPFNHLDAKAGSYPVMTSFATLHMLRPAIMPPELWKMAKRCWSVDPHARPAMADIVPFLDIMLQQHAPVDPDEEKELVSGRVSGYVNKVSPYDAPIQVGLEDVTVIISNMTQSLQPNQPVNQSVSVLMSPNVVQENSAAGSEYDRPLDG